MNNKIIYHGSTDIIEKPIFGKGKNYNDYGRGFYCTENIELAKEWACIEGVDGFANQYLIDTDKLKVLNLCSEEYSILHWLTILTENRKLRISTPTMRRGIDWLQSHFHVDIAPYDVLIGYRADDSYFSFARAFLTNQISLSQLSYAMRLGKLGEQFVLMSEKAFDALQFLTYENADASEYYVKRKTRDEEARKAYIAILEEEDHGGLFMRNIVNGEASVNDPRLW